MTIAERLIGKMIEYNIIDKEDMEIYLFGLNGLLLKLCHYSSYLLIAIFFREVLNFLFFFFAFLLLRKNAGGYHAKTKMGCYIVSCLAIIVAILSIKKFSMIESIAILYIILFVADIIVFLLAPLGNRNRELDMDEMRLFRKGTITILIMENSLFLVFMQINKEQYAVSISLAIIFQAVILLIEKIRESK